MNWKTLLTDKRFRNGPSQESFDGRNQFENDYSRLISSSFIRRLQDKTQVFPLNNSDFIRTRLTHSLEVSSIAKSIGKSVSNILYKTNKIEVKEKELLPDLLWVSGLIHDLGNPPYGHFGETAIKKYFKKYFEYFQSDLTPEEKNDFLNFDGNVQTFRILKKLSFLGDQHSYNLTYPTLACIIKYPVDSTTGNIKNDNITKKKFGYFKTEESEYLEISEFLGIKGLRHPATFLLEAADDIAYSAADIEDGIKIGCLNYEIIYDIFRKYDINYKQDLKLIERLEQLKKDSYKFDENALQYIIGKFRIDTQVLMIKAVITEFINNHDKILSGEYQTELLLESEGKKIRMAFKELSSIVFNNTDVMQAEIAGYEVIEGLLNKFIPASLSEEFKKDGKDLEGRMYRMISSNLRYVYENYSSYPSESYKKIQLIIDFISGMTDSYALNYYKGLTGMSYK